MSGSKFGRSFSTEHEVTGWSHLPTCWFAVCLYLKDSCWGNDFLTIFPSSLINHIPKTSLRFLKLLFFPPPVDSSSVTDCAVQRHLDLIVISFPGAWDLFLRKCTLILAKDTACLISISMQIKLGKVCTSPSISVGKWNISSSFFGVSRSYFHSWLGTMVGDCRFWEILAECLLLVCSQAQCL